MNDLFKPSKWAGDQRWRWILNKVDEMSKGPEYAAASRHSPMEETPHREGELPWVWCKAVFYRRPELVEQDMFLIGCGPDPYYRGPGLAPLIVKADGPYADANDWFWVPKAQEDKPNQLITEDYKYFTVKKDSAKPGQGDGFGGSLFRIWLDAKTAERFEKMGLKVDSLRADGGRILQTRNLWSAGTIPAKHRHLFTPNCKILS